MPKTTFVGNNSLKIGVLDAVLRLNEGSMSRVKVVQELGVDPGKNMVSALRKIDTVRVAKAQKDAEFITNEARVKRRQEKRR